MIYQVSFDCSDSSYVIEHDETKTIVYQFNRYSDSVYKSIFENLNTDLFDKLLYSNENDRNKERLHSEIDTLKQSLTACEFWEALEIEITLKTMLAIEKLLFNQYGDDK